MTPSLQVVNAHPVLLRFNPDPAAASRTDRRGATAAPRHVRSRGGPDRREPPRTVSPGPRVECPATAPFAFGAPHRSGNRAQGTPTTLTGGSVRVGAGWFFERAPEARCTCGR